jgi:UDP-GlcNAc:undecaprenyl-phosphate/decaprenyl-phosphate GlcNAc-1-phosphate transferase
VTRRRTVTRLLAAASGARLAYAALTRAQPGGEKLWARTNHRGEPVSLLEGPAVTAAAAASALIVPGLDRRLRLALGLAGAGAGAVGCYDDLAGQGDRHGFRGHLGALARGEVTTGAVKIVGIGAAGFAAALVLDRRDAPPGAVSGQKASVPSRAVDLAVNGALVAGAANLLNLFDLRPGRAIKVGVLASLALGIAGPQARAAAAAPTGAAIALLPEDLGESSMLGDSGANALGAMFGVAAAASLPRPARIAALGVVAGLTAASERVSFTRVIARTPALNWLDMLGRRPAEQTERAERLAGGGTSAPAETVAPGRSVDPKDPHSAPRPR